MGSVFLNYYFAQDQPTPLPVCVQSAARAEAPGNKPAHVDIAVSSGSEAEGDVAQRAAAEEVAAVKVSYARG